MSNIALTRKHDPNLDIINKVYLIITLTQRHDPKN